MAKKWLYMKYRYTFKKSEIFRLFVYWEYLFYLFSGVRLSGFLRQLPAYFLLNGQVRSSMGRYFRKLHKKMERSPGEKDNVEFHNYHQI